MTFDSRLKVLGAGSFLLVGSALLFGLSFAKSLTTTGTRRRSRDVEGAPGRGAVT